MVDAIEARSAYNATHTRSMVRYADRFIDWLISTDNEWKFDADTRDAFLMSIWLHDLGKLIVPLEVLDKPDRLASLRDGIRSKIEVTRLMAQLDKASGNKDAAQSDERIAALDAAWELIDKTNNAPFVDDETVEELKKCAKIKCDTAYRQQEDLLNERELEAITVQRGTLTAPERKKVEEHVSYTARMLDNMGFGGIYEKVPFWAGSHHELLNGTGYPNHLKDKDIPRETRLITIIDIYDALTAEDRPYKPPMPPEKAFAILEDMGRNGTIDKDILSMFYESGAWQKK